jgi:hypothetical protein
MKKPVSRLHSVIDVLEQRFVHLLDAGEGPLAILDDVCMVESVYRW